MLDGRLAGCLLKARQEDEEVIMRKLWSLSPTNFLPFQIDAWATPQKGEARRFDLLLRRGAAVV